MKNQFDISAFVDVLTVSAAKEKITANAVQRRKKMKMTQRALAKKSGVSYSSVRRFETTGEISLVSLLKIAQALNCLEDFPALFPAPMPPDLKDFEE